MPQQNRTRVLVLLSLAELLAMSLWFTGSVVLSGGCDTTHECQAELALRAWLTMSVQLGFVAGALLIATFNISDVFRAPRVFVASALLAAAANWGFAGFAIRLDEYSFEKGRATLAVALILRGLTGCFLAGVYPTGMKILSGWFREGRGLAIGVLIAALTVGSASPHLLFFISAVIVGLPVRGTILASSALAVVGAAIVALGVQEGPLAAPSPPFDWKQVGEALRNRRLRLANFGYLGHMWELYSMWAWMPALLFAAKRGRGNTFTNELLVFSAIAIGALGCVWAGRASDRLSARAGEMSRFGAGESPASTQFVRGGARTPCDLPVAGRARVTILAMAVSGACCLATAVLFYHFWLVVLISLVWGIAVIADSAQFSTIVSEVADPSYIGTALTMQTALGFLLTTIALRTTAAIAMNFGWRWAAASMAVGPALGIVAMWRLRR